MNQDQLLQMLLSRSAESEEPKKKRKRGGLAGIWDRNKGIIKPVVSGALGLVPGIGVPLAAGAGALMGGLDREGKGGVGFDVGKGVAGGISGAAAGGTAAWANGGGVGRLLGRGASSVPAAGGVPSAVPLPDAPMASSVVGPASSARGLGRLNVGSVTDFITANPQAIGMGLQGAAGILGSQAERRMGNERLTLERERDEEERRRRETTANLLLPLYRQQAQRFQ